VPACIAQRRNAGTCPGCGPGRPRRKHEPCRPYPIPASQAPSISAALQSASAISRRGPEQLLDVTTGTITTAHDGSAGRRPEAVWLTRRTGDATVSGLTIAGSRASSRQGK
jgi:hypothetical protein